MGERDKTQITKRPGTVEHLTPLVPECDRITPDGVDKLVNPAGFVRWLDKVTADHDARGAIEARKIGKGWR